MTKPTTKGLTFRMTCRGKSGTKRWSSERERERAPVVGLTFAGRRHVIGKITEKILAQGARQTGKFDTGLFGAAYKARAKDVLSGRFLIPPFSVLNTRTGFWQERKRQWINLGIRSELGRGYTSEGAAYGASLGKSGDLNARYKNSTISKKYTDHPRGGLIRPIKRDLRIRDASPGGSPRPAMNQKQNIPAHIYNAMSPEERAAVTKGKKLVRGDGYGRPLAPQGGGRNAVHIDDIDGYRNQEDGVVAVDPIGGTSVFDPVLCELVYRWFCRPGGHVLDPFAGGSVRGIVAGELGLHYTGIDLSERQLAANRTQAEAIGTDPAPEWIHGDSAEVIDLVDHGPYDLVFSCPPYGDLEQYSDDPCDLSTLSLEKFQLKYSLIISNACKLLTPNGFACFVVGDYRDADGMYCGFPARTVRAFEVAGLKLYNEAVLLNAIGSLPLRVTAQFVGSRKLGKCHQNVLVFAKGNPREFTKSWQQNLLDVE